MTVPCLSDHDACTIYPVRRDSLRWCCKAREMYDLGSDHGDLSLERLQAACQTLAARGEGFEEVKA
jgi:hypothetical protein